jgi:polyhydroxyalkanoate synthase subunit PhaC
MLSARSRQLNNILGRDPLLRSIDQMLNANPFREIVPVDWAEIARALRTVWMLSLAKPGESMQSAAELNTGVE